MPKTKSVPPSRVAQLRALLANPQDAAAQAALLGRDLMQDWIVDQATLTGAPISERSKPAPPGSMVPPELLPYI